MKTILEKQAYEKNRQLKLKNEVFNAYGGFMCNCCDETIKEFLSLDHINNNGAEERKKNLGGQNQSGTKFYRWLKQNKFPRKEDYQILCMNCNTGKRLNSGVCPHITQNSVKRTDGS